MVSSRFMKSWYPWLLKTEPSISRSLEQAVIECQVKSVYFDIHAFIKSKYRDVYLDKAEVPFIYTLLFIDLIMKYILSSGTKGSVWNSWWLHKRSFSTKPVLFLGVLLRLMFEWLLKEWTRYLLKLQIKILWQTSRRISDFVLSLQVSWLRSHFCSLASSKVFLIVFWVHSVSS